MTNKGVLLKHSVEILKAYAGSERAEPRRFEEVAKSAYDALKALIEHSKNQ